MNSKILLLAVILFTGLCLTSCDDDDDNSPVISSLELGTSDSHVAYIGSDFHVEAEIVAENKIDVITVEIHQEEESSDEIEVEYTAFAGLKNTTFHKHIDIPSTTTAGTYHFHLTVTDQDGNQTTVEDEIAIEELADDEAPVLTISSAPDNGQTFAKDASISISGTVTDNNSLAGMVIALVKKSDNIDDSDVTGDNTSVIVMLHTHTFDSETSHDFSASITVGAEYDNNMTPALIEGDNAWESGDYYILAKCKDAKGNWVFSDHYPIVISL